MNKVRPISVKRLCTFLKLIYDDVHTEAKQLPLLKMAKDLGVPYSKDVVIHLKKKGILSYKKGDNHLFYYKWISSTEPNIAMATAILDICYKYHDEYIKAKAHIEEIKVPDTPINQVKAIIGQMMWGRLMNANATIIQGEVTAITIDKHTEVVYFIREQYCNPIAKSLKELEDLL